MQNDIARELGISLQGYQRFEYGEQESGLSVLVVLAKFYHIFLDELTGLEPPDQR